MVWQTSSVCELVYAWLTALVWRAWTLFSVVFDLNAVQLVWLQSQLHPHFSPQGWNLTSHLAPKIKVPGLSLAHS